MLRVGREAIVSFPNFGHWSHRLQILRGRMPVSDALPYQWYDTPNIHLCTVADFDAFLAKRGCEVADRIVLAGGAPVSFLPNLRGELAIYRFRAAARIGRRAPAAPRPASRSVQPARMRPDSHPLSAARAIGRTIRLAVPCPPPRRCCATSSSGSGCSTSRKAFRSASSTRSSRSTSASRASSCARSACCRCSGSRGRSSSCGRRRSTTGATTAAGWPPSTSRWASAMLYFAVQAGFGPSVWLAIGVFTALSATNDVAIDGYTIEFLDKRRARARQRHPHRPLPRRHARVGIRADGLRLAGLARARSCWPRSSSSGSPRRASPRRASARSSCDRADVRAELAALARSPFALAVLAAFALGVAVAGRRRRRSGRRACRGSGSTPRRRGAARRAGGDRRTGATPRPPREAARAAPTTR